MAKVRQKVVSDYGDCWQSYPVTAGWLLAAGRPLKRMVPGGDVSVERPAAIPVPFVIGRWCKLCTLEKATPGAMDHHTDPDHGGYGIMPEGALGLW